MGNSGPITLIIIAITCLVSIGAFSNRDTFNKLVFDPYLIDTKKQWYRFFSHAFVHADWVHLGFNMLALYSLGGIVENYIYPAIFHEKANFYYVLLYVGGIFFSSIYSFGKHRHNPYYSAVGASGAVSAVIMPFVLFSPWAKLQFFFIPMWAWLFGVIYLVGSWYLGKKNVGNIGHDAHFWGAAFGIAFTLALEPGMVHHFIDQLMNAHP